MKIDNDFMFLLAGIGFMFGIATLLIVPYKLWLTGIWLICYLSSMYYFSKKEKRYE